MSDSAISFVMLGVTVVLFVWNRFPPEIVALGAAIALYATGVLDANQVFAGFGDPVMPFLAGLFVVSEGLDASGVTGWAGQQLISRAGSRSQLVVLLLAFVAVLSALITVNGAVPALLPMAVLVALRIGGPPSQLLMPLAFAASAGSLLVLTGNAREEVLHSDTRHGMLRALTVTGAFITSAGVVFAGTFAALASLPLVTFTEIGFIIAFGVLLDTFLVRTILVPALVLDLDRRVWWPSALSRQPPTPPSSEHHAPEATAAR